MHYKFTESSYENASIDLFIGEPSADKFWFFERVFSKFPQDDFIKGEMG